MEIICEYNDFIIVKVGDKYYKIDRMLTDVFCSWDICEVELVERISEDEYTAKGWTDDDLILHCPDGCENRVLTTGEELNGIDYLYFAEI